MIVGNITKYSHFYTIIVKSPAFGTVLAEFMRSEFLELGLNKVRGKFRWTPKRMWCRRNTRTGERAFNINTYSLFLDHIAKHGLTEENFKVVQARPYKGVKVEFTGECYTPFPQQEPLINHALGEHHQYAITASPGFGKGSVLDARIRIPGGWRLMGDIRVGDTIVAWDGTPCTVTGVYPQGLRPCYRVLFDDGRSTIVDDTHLWSVRFPHTEHDTVISTLDVSAELDKGTPLTVPLIKPESFYDQYGLIPPYLLGIILTHGRIDHNTVIIDIPNEVVYNRVVATLPPELTMSLYKHNGYCIQPAPHLRRRILLDALHALSLVPLSPWDSAIPNVYLESSLPARIQCVQALMDCNGYFTPDGRVAFKTINHGLAVSLQYLLRSMGDSARLSENCVYMGTLTDYTLDIHTTDQSRLFSQSIDVNVSNPDLRLPITSITPVGDKPTQCISIDHPDKLYVTDDFIVTHNTVCALLVAKHLSVKFAVVTRGGYSGRWIPAFYEMIGLTPEEIVECCGAKSIEKLVKLIKEGKEKNIKAFFFSIGGMRDYIKNYESGKYKKRSHPCRNVPPERLFEFLGIGFKIVDEAHQELHAHYMLDLYMNIKHSLYLTGTLIAQTPFMDKVYNTFLPQDIRKADDKLEIYASAVEVFYKLHNPSDAKFIGPQGSYSHVVYEQWLMRSPARLKNWLEMLFEYVNEAWVSKRTEPTKALIFAATVELCNKMAQYFQKQLPDLRIVQYKAGDPYSYLEDYNIIFATLGKAGVAVDIEGLEQVFMTTAIDSGNASIQAFGRLRKLKKYPGLTPVFHWFSSLDIDKQKEYGKNKRGLLVNRVKGINSVYLNRKV